jgi:hypothetical protein
MRHLAMVCVFAGSMAGARSAYAQEPPPTIPRYVIDLHATVPMFPNDRPDLANSRGLSLAELPGAGLGGQVGLHVYLFKWKALTVGVGGEAMVGHASSTPSAAALASAAAAIPPAPAPVPVSERLTEASPQLSFNFGTGHGWSYISGGVGRSQWSLRPSGQAASDADAEVLPTVNYGGGARWFIKRHLAFSFDVRVYEIQPGSPFGANPGSPRARVLTIGAGVSVK